jgi:putative transposase
MTTTLDDVKSKNSEPSAEEIAARVVGACGEVLETALNEEMTEHLGHEKNRAGPERDSGNVRNGARPKTVLTEASGHVHIEVPRDRDGTFDPVDAQETPTPPQRGG